MEELKIEQKIQLQKNKKFDIFDEARNEHNNPNKHENFYDPLANINI